MPVKEADPAAQSLDAAFAQAMGAPARPKEPKAPPAIDPEAPHGRDDQGVPLEPFGRTKEGKIRLSAAGRKPKEDQPRVGKPEPEPAKGGGSKLEPHDFTEGIGDTFDSIWVGLTFAGELPLEKLPLADKIPIGKGRKLAEALAGAGEKIQAQAMLLKSNSEQLAGALNIAANNSPRARRFAERLEGGDATWAIMCGAMLLPFVTQSRMLWSGELKAAELAEANKQTFQTWTAQFVAAVQPAAEPDPQLNGKAPQ